VANYYTQNRKYFFRKYPQKWLEINRMSNISKITSSPTSILNFVNLETLDLRVDNKSR